MDVDKYMSKILIVDDNAANVLLLSKMLNIAGYNHMKTLTDSRKVLDLLNVYIPDLILLDFRMPFIDGLQIIDLLKSVKDYIEFPIIMISAENEAKYHKKALDKGAVDFITKPFNYNDITFKIKNALQTP